MHRQTPPYRAGMVGSLLRGARLKQARTKFAAGDLSAEALRGVEDEEIVALIARQEEIGLEAVTDGEFRRSYAEMINHAIADRPSDMVITMHLCRGNFRSTFVASGGYKPVADLLFNFIGADGYFMEWDTDRAGGFEPLRFLPKGKTVVL